MNTDKEKSADCWLEIAVLEQSRIIGKDSKSFSFVMDGNAFYKFETASYGETEEGLCLISQMYYDANEDAMSLCSLLYPEDMSYAVLRLGDALYYINNGADIAYTELPIA